MLADDAEQPHSGTVTNAAEPSTQQTYAPVKDVDVEAPAPRALFVAESARADSLLNRMSIDAGSRTNSSANIRLDDVVLTPPSPLTSAAAAAAAEANVNVITARKGSSANIITLRKGSSTALLTARLNSAAKLSPEEVGVGVGPAAAAAAAALQQQQQQQQQQQKGTIIVSSSYSTSGSSTDLRRKISGASLRPHVPANRKLH